MNAAFRPSIRVIPHTRHLWEISPTPRNFSIFEEPTNRPINLPLALVGSRKCTPYGLRVAHVALQRHRHAWD